ncbi:MAG: hypothetical protein M0P91_07025 [Sulfuricurvum sp.]|jgi:hypothetical protein|uniref:hypothetical protein n=1 Tax=Sulfuricurvum sp. TaxID=2025608 RepID=UPI0025E9BE8A|nr:hypothetical protein [Sulfuricurvum sp.]MCK9372932.1 hypothetical protein [Sulfuricurvum sp.]
MEILIRYFVFLSFLLCIAKGEDVLLVNTYVRMIPKIMVLDTQAALHNPANKTILAVVYEDKNKNSAKKIAEEINGYYGGRIGNLSFSAVALPVEELINRHDIAFAYLTQMGKYSISQISAWGISNSVPTFSYDPKDLDNGILGSIAIERTTVIYLNKNVLKLSKIRFNETLFQIARLIE